MAYKIKHLQNFQENMSDFTVNNVPADGLTPLGARSLGHWQVPGWQNLVSIYLQHRHLKS